MESEQQREISEEVDRMWAEHIMACLAIINTLRETNNDTR